jgi:hypothetical protein
MVGCGGEPYNDMQGLEHILHRYMPANHRVRRERCVILYAGN